MTYVHLTALLVANIKGSEFSKLIFTYGRRWLFKFANVLGTTGQKLSDGFYGRRVQHTQREQKCVQ